MASHEFISAARSISIRPDLESRFASIADSVKSSAIIDLAGIDYLSSIGVRALVTTGKAIASRGGRLVLLNPQDVVRTVLFTTGVNDVMPIVFGDSTKRCALQEPERPDAAVAGAVSLGPSFEGTDWWNWSI